MMVMMLMKGPGCLFLNSYWLPNVGQCWTDSCSRLCVHTSLKWAQFAAVRTRTGCDYLILNRWGNIGCIKYNTWWKKSLKLQMLLMCSYTFKHLTECRTWIFFLFCCVLNYFDYLVFKLLSWLSCVPVTFVSVFLVYSHDLWDLCHLLA